MTGNRVRLVRLAGLPVSAGTGLKFLPADNAVNRLLALSA